MSETSLTGKDLWVEITRLRAQLTTEMNTSQGYRKLYDEAQREVERLTKHLDGVCFEINHIGLEARCARLEDGIKAVSTKVTCYPSGSTLITPSMEAGALAFWDAVRNLCALAEGQP